jgi:hypothetical protein
MAYFYPFHDRETGYTIWGDDQSRQTKIPFMNAITGTLRSTDGPFEDIQALHRLLVHGTSS